MIIGPYRGSNATFCTRMHTKRRELIQNRQKWQIVKKTKIDEIKRTKIEEKL